MNKSIKPWKSFEDQLALLQKRGIIVDDREAALSYLERIGYYRLSGYYYPFRKFNSTSIVASGGPKRLDEFIEGSKFEDVVKLYVFDKKLRLLALDALERIEMAVRVDVAHLLGEKDPLAYTNPTYLDGNFTKKKISKGINAGKIKYQVWQQKYNANLQRSNKVSFVQHNLSAYGKLPIWVAIEVWDFGLLSQLFAGMKYGDREAIACKYGVDSGNKFSQWLRSLNYIRNVSAHHSRLWNLNVVETSAVPKSWEPSLNKYRPFIYFCFMQHLLNIICPNSKWNQRFKNFIESEFPKVDNNAISLDNFGVVEGWDNWPMWQ